MQCLEYGEEMVLGTLAVYQQTYHSKAAVGRRHWVTMAPGGDPQTFKMDFPTAGVPRNCPVKGCQGQAATRMEMQVPFLHDHVRYTVIILEEVNLIHPQCPRCNMMVPCKELNKWHITTAQCSKWL